MLPGPAWSMDKKRILIIDDDASLRFVLKRPLSRAGHEVLEAPDGPTGLEAALAHNPDLIVLDGMMPGVDGFEVCRRLKAWPATTAIPIIFLSGSLTPALRRQAFALGAADVLVKPQEIEALLPAVEAVFRRQEQGAWERGRVVAMFGHSAAGRAIDLAQAVAQHSNWPVLLIDLDLQQGTIGARLSIQPDPDCVDLLERGPVPLTDVDIRDCAQPYRLGLEVIPAPFGGGMTHPERVTAALAELRAAGYYVVVHAGTVLNRLAVAAIRGANLTCALTGSGAEAGHSFRVLLSELTALGIDTQTVVPVGIPAILAEAGRHPALGRATSP